MQSPNNSDDSSGSPEVSPLVLHNQSCRRSSTIISSTRQSRSNPQQHLLNRNEQNCPQFLTEAQRTRWFKAGRKAERNVRLVQQLPILTCPTSFYKTPIHIQHLTPHSAIDSVFDKIRDATVYVSDTELEPPTSHQSEPTPALIQIQATHSPHEATMFLIAVQFLPHHSTYTYFSFNHFVTYGCNGDGTLVPVTGHHQSLSPVSPVSAFTFTGFSSLHRPLSAVAPVFTGHRHRFRGSSLVTVAGFTRLH